MPSLLLDNDEARRKYISLDVTGDLAPLCDLHNAPMRPNSILPRAFSGCTKDNLCERRYDPSIGCYGGTSLTNIYRAYCIKHYRPLYLCAYGATST